MIRKFEKNDINAVMEIWVNENIRTHNFIAKEYWKDNYEYVKDILPKADIYVYILDEQVVGFVSDILREYDREVMCVICLNAKLNPVNMCICSMGAVDKAIASPREIMKTVILSNANGFIILHNHPGGSSQPSLEDIHVTDVMSKAGELLGIPLYDHIIAAAGSDEIYSFYEKGSMPQSQLKYADRVADINLRSDMAETNEIRKPLKLHQIKI